jgi:hypothetical protein
MDSENLQQLKKEIKQEMSEVLNSSKITNIFQSYGLTEDGLIKFQCILDLTKIQLNNTLEEDQQFKASLLAIPEQELLLMCCCSCPLWCCPCC